MTESPKRRISWVRILIEGVVIVGSILLAFAIDAWWDQQRDRIEESQIIQDLADEISLNVETANRVAARHGEYGDRMRVLEAMGAHEAMSLPADSALAYLTAPYAWPTFDPRTSTLDGVVNSGRLEIIADPDLRHLLADWQRRLGDLGEEAALVTRAAERFIARFAEHGPLPTDGAGGLAAGSREGLANQQLLTLLEDAELMGLARTKVFFGNQYRGELQRTADFAATILAVLGSE